MVKHDGFHTDIDNSAKGKTGPIVILLSEGIGEFLGLLERKQ
jgi:hypothetical protein